MKKRLLASLMSLCLIMGLLPTTAWATGDGDSSSGGTKNNPWNVSAEGENNNVTAYLTTNEIVEATYGDVITLQSVPSETYTLHIEGSGEMQDFVATTVEGEHVPWAAHKEQIVNVVIGNGITHIGVRSFDGFTKLKTVDIPEGVSSIGNRAFQKSGITEITLPSGITKLEDGTFWQCTSLEKINLGNITEIGANVFDGCSSLKEVDLSNLTSMGNLTFQDCTSLESVALGEKISELPIGTFYDCTTLKSIAIPDSVKTIGANCFRNSGLTSADLNCVETIADTYAFAGCTSLTSIDLGNLTGAIPGHTFSGCTQLAEIRIPSRVTEINYNAFDGCTNIEGLIFSGEEDSGNLTLQNSNFEELSNLKEVYIDKNITNSNENLGIFTEWSTDGLDIVFGDHVTTIPTHLTVTEGTGSAVNKIVFGKSISSVDSASFVGNNTIKMVDLSALENLPSGINLSNMIAESVIYVSTDDVADELKGTLNAEGQNYAKWKSAVAVLNGGYISASAEITTGELAIPVLDGHTFDGWYSDKDFSNRVEENKIISENQDYGKYYAKWSSIENTGDEPSDTSNTAPEQSAEPISAEPIEGAPAEDIPVVEVPAPMDVAPVAPATVLGCASAITMSLTHMAPGDGSGDGDETVYSFYEGDKKLGTTVAGETALTYDTVQKGLKIGSNEVRVYKGNSNMGEPAATITVNLKQKPVTVIGLTAEDRSYDGSTGIVLTGGTLSGLEENDDVTFTATGTVSEASVGTNKPVTVTVALGGSDAGWYTATASGVTVDIYKTSSGGGGGSGSTTYAIKVENSRHGEVDSNRTRASSGSTVTLTVTPDEGYVLDELVVTDKDGDTVKLTNKGNDKYSFTMPRSAVTVEASFAAEADPDIPAFIDVPADAYYADAVAWAVANGVTNGTSATTFGPDVSCTRAQMVTLLWRAAGSPAPKSTANPFTDVQADAYYYDAVLWAAEQGITSGTSATTFAPDATVTRGQTVTFLHRTAGSPTATGSSFADVATDAYYAGAVAWAVSENITAGTGRDLFSPNAACTRAQIVTFLYRAEQ